MALTTFNKGKYAPITVHSVPKTYKTPHATVLDITQEEFRERGSSNKWGMAGGSYTQHGIQFTDIHSQATQLIRFDEQSIGLLFLSEEGEVEGAFIDVFDTKKGHLGRHLVSFPHDTLRGAYFTLLESNGPEELYIFYYTPEMVPMLSKMRLVMK